MNFAVGLMLGVLKVSVLAAAILAVLWTLGKGAQALYACERKASLDRDIGPAADAGEDPER